MAAPVGNSNAAKGRIWADAVRTAIARSEGGDLAKGLAKLADKLVEAAERGDQWALAEIANRLDGKPAQQIDLSGDLELRGSLSIKGA